MSADVRYARNGRVAVAHQILGDGPIDLVLVPGFASHLDVMWEEPRSPRSLTCSPPAPG
jgi:hypothetical protein